MLASIFLSGSRGGFVSVVVVLIYFAIKTKNRLVMLGIAAASSLIFLAFPTVLHRLTEAQTASTGSGRTFIWSVGAKALSEHWISGTGIGTFPLAYDRAIGSTGLSAFEGWSRPAHNVLVGTSVELGLMGVALVLIAWYLSFRQTSNIARTSPNYTLRIASEAVVLGVFINALFLDVFLIKLVWLVFMIPIMLHNVERARPTNQKREISSAFLALMERRYTIITKRQPQWPAAKALTAKPQSSFGASPTTESAGP
jgi:O-antigen ligase